MTKLRSIKRMRNVANSYFIAYMRCIEQRKLNLTTIQFLPIPALTCIAFSCEIYLKTLLHCFGISHPKVHNLKKLFNLLPKDIQEKIRESYDNPLKFDNNLENAREYFATSRYLYEKEDRSFSFTFIEWFCKKLKETIDNKISKLEKSQF